MAKSTKPQDALLNQDVPAEEAKITASTPAQMQDILGELPAEVEVVEVATDQPAVINTTILNTNVAITKTELHPGLVNVEVKYPSDYKGDKYLEDGKVYPVSEETAKILVEQQKIGKIVK